MEGDRRLPLCEIPNGSLLFAQEDNAYEDHQKSRFLRKQNEAAFCRIMLKHNYNHSVPY